jgi:hypothetical protein
MALVVSLASYLLINHANFKDKVHMFSVQCRILKLHTMTEFAMWMTYLEVICGQNGKRNSDYKIDSVFHLTELTGVLI